MTCRSIYKRDKLDTNDILKTVDSIIKDKEAKVKDLKTKQSNTVTPKDNSSDVMVVQIVPSMFEIPDTISGSELDNSLRLAESLQIIANVLDAQSIKIKRGYDKSAKDTSLHKSAKAVDFIIPDQSNVRVYELTKKLMENGAILKGGVGLYPTHIHLDISGDYKYWTSENESGFESEIDTVNIDILAVENANQYKEYSSIRRMSGEALNDSTPIQNGGVAVPAKDIQGRDAVGYISTDASLTNSAWRLNVLKKIGITKDINDRIVPKSETTQADYEVDNKQPWGPHWQKCRPPGLHKNARRCSKKGASDGMIRSFGQKGKKDARYTITEVIPIDKDMYHDYITATGWQKSEDDAEEFWLVAEAVFKLETNGYVGIPQGEFDFRPLENALELPLSNNFDEGPFYPEDPTRVRKKGNVKVTTPYRDPSRQPRSVWGAWQYVSDTWQDDMEKLQPGILRTHPDWVYPWFAPVKYEIGARLWIYKDLWNEVRSMEVGLQGSLHLAQKASVMYMFNHQPTIKTSFLAHYAQFRASNPTILSAVEMFYRAWGAVDSDGLCKWLPRYSGKIDPTDAATASLGYKISTKLYEKGKIVKTLETNFRHGKVKTE